jgi:polyhydroxybutyrate depolymerase
LGSDVFYYNIEGMGHTWPGGKNLLPEIFVGKSSDKMDATVVIWEFIQNFPKPCLELVKDGIKIRINI